jgi:ABC-2 type transport system permease protein
MLATVFTKTTRDRWIGAAVASGAIALWLLMGMAVYRDIDLAVYTELPEVWRALAGIPEGSDVGVLAFSVIFGFAAAVVLASIALSMGASSIAGEERDGTMGLLLGNPKTRAHVLLSKAAAMTVLLAGATLVLYGASLVVPRILSVATGGVHLEAIAFHLLVNAMFYGTLAMLIGAWTGERSKASGVTVTVMLLSFFAVGILPLIEGAADFARIFPWYYFDSSDPVVNGVEWGHLAILGGLSIAFLALAVVGVNRRDLRERTVRTGLIDRLREHPATRTMIDRLAGSTRVSRVWIKTLSEHQGLVIISGYLMFLVMGVLMGPMYLAIDDTLADFSEMAPEALMALVGNADMSTPEGWFETETFSMMAPIAVALVTVAIGAKALAGEESDRTMGLLLGNPIKRSSVVLEKVGAMTAGAVIVGVLTFLGVWFGSLVSGLGMSVGNIAAICLLVTLFGLVIGAAALALGALTGRVRIAVYGAIGIGLVSYLVTTLFTLSDQLARFATWTPFHYYFGDLPLTNGLDPMHAVVLTVMFVVLVGLSVVLFERRDLRETG